MLAFTAQDYFSCLRSTKQSQRYGWSLEAVQTEYYSPSLDLVGFQGKKKRLRRLLETTLNYECGSINDEVLSAQLSALLSGHIDVGTKLKLVKWSATTKAICHRHQPIHLTAYVVMPVLSLGCVVFLNNEHNWIPINVKLCLRSDACTRYRRFQILKPQHIH